MVDWKSVREGLVSHILVAAIVAGGGAVIGLLAAYHSVWALPVFYGIVGAAAIAVLIFALTGRALFSRKQPETTTANAEDNIKKWLAYFGLGVQQQENQQAHFMLVTTCRSGVRIIIARLKARDRYVWIGGNLELAKEHQSVLQQLPKEHSGRVVEEIAMELARNEIGYDMTFSPDGTLTMVSVSKTLPITSSLTEEAFIAGLDKVESNMQVAREAVRLLVDRAKSQISKQ